MSSNFRDFCYSYSVLGRPFARIDHFSLGSSRILWSASPCHVIHLPQHTFEDILRREISDISRHNENSQQLYGFEITNINDISSNTTKLSVRSNEGKSTEISCRFLIGADGANSLIRKTLHIEMSGRKELQTLVNVHFKCKNFKALLLPRPAMLYFVFNEVSLPSRLVHLASKSVHRKWSEYLFRIISMRTNGYVKSPYFLLSKP